ncbi:LacI family transcriptional regulator [Hydrogenispora ethanolica]|uniref:LacI family transcriptional regulator n=1 Tax=Hydrogenispora ethanolica TaxID=1082276 RepID=A0A4R1R8S8_HYDET|nr:LacI family DNA-binding transcriptional regulator [Hydrogenispora ethanolica]TCL62073.1 LacI family transcriptional regulator [Hydrogenispora ethanolica]
MKMQDVAKLAGVSTATISRVLNQPEMVREETRRRVQQVLEQTQYVANAFARGLVVSSMKTIGILTNDITSAYVAGMFHTIERRFTELGYNVILANTGMELENKKKSLRMILERQVDAVILIGSMYKERKSNAHIFQAAAKVPVLIINNYIQAANVYSITCDDACGIRQAVQYLADLGHRHIYYFIDSRTPSALAKLKGFQQGMAANGLDPGNVLPIACSLEGAAAGLRELIAKNPRVTAVVCGEDIVGIGVMKGCIQMKLRVPEDISVIGYNNTILAEAATPSLTTVDNDLLHTGLEAVHKLYDVFQGKPVAKKTAITPTLVIRESTGPVPER